MAIVGESGCGKSTFAKVMMGLETATEGEIRLNGKDISRTRVQKRGADTVGYMQMVFQNPFDTLNPSHSVGSQIARVVQKFGGESDPARGPRARVRAARPGQAAARLLLPPGRASSRAGRSSASASPARSPATPRW